MSRENALFEPVEHASVVDLVVEQVELLILNGILRDGHKLPSERELADRLSVSRPKVREGLKILEERGLINVRHGEGTFVAPLVGAAMSPALIDLYSRHSEAFCDYLEFRMQYESFAAGLAADRATKTDLEMLSEIVEALKQAHANDDGDASRDADIRFHGAIIDASHNSFLIHSTNSIYELTRQNVFYNRKILRAIDGTGEKLLAQHIEIFDAIVARDAEAARQAAEAHIALVEKSYLADLTRDQRELVSERRRAMLSG